MNCDTDVEHIHGVNLTKEWLKSKGFNSVSNNENWELFERDGVTIDVSYQDNSFVPAFNGQNIGRCIYIHRIQTFFLLCTGEWLYS